ncbi:MAG: SHOCT domain-containing protein [Candidatus Bathyarchaeota archaeon]|nr:MAG: SHOCT domain-containing protein [Candidatus Bathyarchaeota archaeon]
MFLIPTVFLVLIAIGIYYLIAGAIRQEKPVSDLGKKSLEILKQRYAKGEITREQFLIMRKELEL